MIKRSRRSMAGFLIPVLASLVGTAGWLYLRPDRPTRLDDRARAAIITALTRELNRSYVFPDRAAAMETVLRARQHDHAYDDLDDLDPFASALTEQLQATSHDKHLRVRTAVGPTGEPRDSLAPNPFGAVKRLDGNIAYVEIASFRMAVNRARIATSSAMGGVADAAALILDVRHNGGGDPGTVALVSSYLFGDKPVLLNSIYSRRANRTDDFYTDPQVAGAKFGPLKPVYVLISGRTFSAAEEFAYDLQSRRRAVIVGERSGGGANPGQVVPLPRGLEVFVPNGRAINPITRTNWEGTGVQPDVAVPAADALEAAHRLAIEAISPKR